MTIEIKELEVPHFMLIGDEVFDAAYGNDLQIDVEIESDGGRDWAIGKIWVYARRINDKYRAHYEQVLLPPTHPMHKPLKKWINDRCSDLIDERWEAWLSDAVNRKADARRAAQGL